MVLMIVSGRSGSGKSVALRGLEDIGFLLRRNLPMVLLPQLVSTLAASNTLSGVSVDVRNMPESPEIFEQVMDNLPQTFFPTDPVSVIATHLSAAIAIPANYTCSPPGTYRWKALNMMKGRFTACSSARRRFGDRYHRNVSA